MRAAKRAPGGRPLTTGWDALGFENGGNRRSCHAMAPVLQRPLYPRVPPTWILPGHPHGKVPNLGEHPGAPTSPPRVRPLPHTQFAMPSKNGVGRHERRYVTRRVRRRCPSCARRRRCGSVNRSRRPASCVFSTRVSSRRNAITSRCSRSSHPSSAARSICNGNTAVSLRQCAARVFGHYELSPFTHRDGKFATPLALPVSSRTWSPVFARSTT